MKGMVEMGGSAPVNGEEDGFVRCGDTWVRFGTINGITVEWQRSIGSDEVYEVKVRTDWMGRAPTYSTHRSRAEAEGSAEALAALVIGRSTDG